MNSRNKKKNIGAVVFIIAFLSWGYFFGYGDTEAKKYPVQYKVDEKALYRDVEYLSTLELPRNVYNISVLNDTANYIKSRFEESGCMAIFQSFTIGEGDNTREFHNVECRLGPGEGERIIIGAHYDVEGDKPGADDNATGVAGLIELARLIGESEVKLNKGVTLVAFTLEEPPLFGTSNMGSAKYVEHLKDNNVEVDFMISLEMIGYFTENKKSQKYPSWLMHFFYPSKGNFIALVGQWGDRKLTKKLRNHMRDASTVKVRSLNAPARLSGVDFSDHRSFWLEGFRAYMITDTAFFRNHHYHEKTDTIDNLNFKKMAQVVGSVFHIIKMETSI